MFKNKVIILFIILTFAFTSCAPSVPMVKEKTEVDKSIPESFPTFSADKAKDAQEEKKEDVLPEITWEKFFKDEKLISLIEFGLKNNQELNQIAQEVNISDNEVLARTGEYFPKIGLGANYESEKVGEKTSQGVSDESHGLSKTLHNHQVGLYASWELDIWGKLRNASKAAYYHYLASSEGQKYFITNLVAEIASSYYELLALDNQINAISEYIDILNRALDLLTLQLQAAKVNRLAVKRFESEVLKNQARKYEVRQKIVEQENRLNLLLGRFPQKIERSSLEFLGIKPKDVTAGVPVDLLKNRPDIKQAELELESSKLNVSSARKRFYPAFSIDAGYGYQSFNREHLFERPDSIFTNLAVNLTAPLLNRTAIEADYRTANNKQIQALYNYEYTLIKAYTDVVNQLSMIKNMDKAYELKTKEVDTLKESAKISTLLFKNARVDYIESLLTQRDSLEAQVELIEVKKDQLISYVYLYKALGGGWKRDDLK